jgi:pimeloyl-ACP methyl ester carboxylesterase
VLVGHSIAGAELSAVASAAPDRTAGLVYLEAAYPYAFNNGTGPTSARVARLPGAHFVFLSNQRDVLRETRGFLARVKPSSGVP